MHDQRTGDDPVESDNNHDGGVLSTLLIDNEAPWTADELIRYFADEVSVIDSIDRLLRGGLIRRTADGLLYPTRAAVYFDQIHG